MNFLKKIMMQKEVTPELISIHIPKTAGTSFAEILKELYGNEHVGSLHVQSIGEQDRPRITYYDAIGLWNQHDMELYERALELRKLRK